MIKSRAMLLAGVSALAMLACVAEADAETFLFTGGEQSFPVLVSGEYALDVFGASGGNATGGRGAEVSGDIFLTAGETLTLFVGGRGQNGHNPLGGGGGGGAFVFLGTSVLAVAGGGGGGTPGFDGGPGQAGTAGGMGGGASGGAGGASGSGGGGGTNFDIHSGFGFNGGGGAGVASGAAGYGGDGVGLGSGSGAKFPNGGAGYTGLVDGGFGGGGGGGAGGGGGGGFSGGGGGDGFSGFGGGGGGSYLASLFTNQALTAGVNLGDGSIDIELLKAVPEPSTWAMMLAGFTGLGWLAHMRRRKITPA